MGHSDIRVSVRNVGGSTCSLIGTPDLTARDSAGKVTAIPTVAGPVLGYAGIVGYATINPGESAWLIIEGSLSCDGGINATSYGNVSVDLPASSLSVPATALTTTCPIRVSTWYLPADANYRAPDRFASVEVAIEAPDSARRGTDLVYTVTLTNYLGPVSLTPCPIYSEVLGSITATYRLNCTMSTLSSGSLRFEMRLSIPADMTAGPTDLRWQIDEPGVIDNISDKVTVTLV
jgi:hypothetical protein